MVCNGMYLTNFPGAIARACKGLLLACVASTVLAQEDLIVYDDALENGWQSYGWATLNYTNTSTVHTGSDSISVATANFSALYLHHDAFDTGLYTNLTFWIHGGSTGGQSLKVQALLNGQARSAVNLPLLPA